MKKAIASLGDVSAIPDAKVIGSWPVAVELSHLDIFQPFSHFITSLCEVAVHLSQIKAKNNVDDTTALHKAIHVQLADKIGKFKDHLFITKEHHNYMNGFQIKGIHHMCFAWWYICLWSLEHIYNIDSNSGIVLIDSCILTLFSIQHIQYHACFDMFLNQDNVLRVAPNALKIDDNDFNIQLIMETLDALVSALVATELNYVKSNTLAFKQELKEVVIDIVNNRPINVENAATQCEQLSLRIACFPDNDPDKRIGLMAAEFAKKLCDPGHICVVLSFKC